MEQKLTTMTRKFDSENYKNNVSSTNYTDTYVAETHVIEGALKERYLTGQSGFACDLSLRRRAVTIMAFF
jgi:hypothetical protein